MEPGIRLDIFCIRLLRREVVQCIHFFSRPLKGEGASGSAKFIAEHLEVVKNWRQIWKFPLYPNAFICHSQLREETELNGLRGTHIFINFMSQKPSHFWMVLWRCCSFSILSDMLGLYIIKRSNTYTFHQPNEQATYSHVRYTG